MNKKIITSLMLILALSACAQPQAETKPTAPAATTTPTLSFDTPAPPENTPEAGDPAAPVPFPTFTPLSGSTSSGPSNLYAVVHVPLDDVLNIRSGPGVGNPAIGALQPNQSGLTRTGKTASAGEDTWVEIQNPGGGTGWVNAEFLTEFVHPSSFCGDTRVTSLLKNLKTAVNTMDGKLLQSLVSPAHGMDVVFIRLGTAANYSPEEAAWAFQSTYEVNWGTGHGSGEPVKGTFPELVLPALQETFKNESLTCNEIKLGGETYVVEWPGEYANLNFYSIHNPSNDPTYGGMDWRTWLAGVEYVDGQPYLFALLHYQWEP